MRKRLKNVVINNRAEVMDIVLFLVFISSYLIILHHIGLKLFMAKDWYKVVFPFHILIYLRSKRDILHICIAFINITSITIWLFVLYNE